MSRWQFIPQISTMRESSDVEWGLRSTGQILKIIEIAIGYPNGDRHETAIDSDGALLIPSLNTRIAREVSLETGRMRITWEIKAQGITYCGQIGINSMTPSQQHSTNFPISLEGLRSLIIPMLRLARRYKTRTPSPAPGDWDSYSTALDHITAAAFASDIRHHYVILGRLSCGSMEIIVASDDDVEYVATPHFAAFISPLITKSFELDAKRFVSYDSRHQYSDFPPHISLDLQVPESNYIEDHEIGTIDALRWIASPPISGPWFIKNTKPRPDFPLF